MGVAASQGSSEPKGLQIPRLGEPNAVGTLGWYTELERLGALALDAPLRSGAIALLDAHWIVKEAASGWPYVPLKPPASLKRRQELPPEAFLSLAQIQQSTSFCTMGIDMYKLTIRQSVHFPSSSCRMVGYSPLILTPRANASGYLQVCSAPPWPYTPPHSECSGISAPFTSIRRVVAAVRRARRHSSKRGCASSARSSATLEP